MLSSKNSSTVSDGVSAAELIRRPEITYADLKNFDTNLPYLPRRVITEVQIELKYKGYIDRQLDDVKRARKLENHRIPDNIRLQFIIDFPRGSCKLSAYGPLISVRHPRISGVSACHISYL